MLCFLFNNDVAMRYITFAGIAFSFILTFAVTKLLKEKLPTDLGRAFAVNAEKAKGKPRGAGILFVLVFTVCAFIFTPFSFESLIYLVLLVLAMLSGFLDDASHAPWGEYKKGLLDLLISVAITYTFTTGTTGSFGLGGKIGMVLPFSGNAVYIPVWLYLILGTVLVWASINVINCTDGVDGLCGSLSLISLGGFAVIASRFYTVADAIPVLSSGALEMGNKLGTDMRPWIYMFMACIAAYLLFNAGPSLILMGDAGSRTIGVFMALTAMKSGMPLVYLLLCLIFILDGGLGLIKVSLLRFLKIKILKNIRTPLHDHARKNKGWSDTQTVIRFCILHLAVVFATIYFIL